MVTLELQITGPFHRGALVILTLGNPREKFWGAILHLSPEGVSMRGVDLVAFEDLVSQIRAGDPFTSGGQDPAPMLVSEFLRSTGEPAE